MHTKIKIPLFAFALILIVPVWAQRHFQQTQINMGQPESVAAFTTLYQRNPATGQPEIRIEQTHYLPAYTSGEESSGWYQVATCQAAQPLNLENVACLISDASLAAHRIPSGEAEIQVLVDAKGKYLSHRIMSVEYDALVAATEKQIDQIRFLPAQQEGRAVACWIDLRFVFKE